MIEYQLEVTFSSRIFDNSLLLRLLHGFECWYLPDQSMSVLLAVKKFKKKVMIFGILL